MLITELAMQVAPVAAVGQTEILPAFLGLGGLQQPVRAMLAVVDMTPEQAVITAAVAAAVLVVPGQTHLAQAD